MEVEFEPQRTTEDLWAVPCDGTLKDAVSRPRDIKIAKGAIVWACERHQDGWVITVEREGPMLSSGRWSCWPPRPKVTARGRVTARRGTTARRGRVSRIGQARERRHA